MDRLRWFLWVLPLLLSNQAAPPAAWRRGRWRTILTQAIRDPVEVCRRLGVPEEFAAEAARSTAGFGVLVPQPYLARIRPGDPNDPLLAQVLPRTAELVETPHFVADPLYEAGAIHAPDYWESIKADS